MGAQAPDGSPAAIDGAYKFVVTYSAGRVSVEIDGEAYAFDTSLPTRSGPALDSTRLVFDSVRWE